MRVYKVIGVLEKVSVTLFAFPQSFLRLLSFGNVSCNALDGDRLSVLDNCTAVDLERDDAPVLTATIKLVDRLLRLAG